MKRLAGRCARWLTVACLLLLVAGVVAPRISAERYRAQIQAALVRAMGRQVEIAGPLHFNVFTGVGFAVEKVTIHEDPSIGAEPMAYVGSLEAVPRVWSLFTRKLEFSSIRLDEASINLTKTGPADQPGRWNFAPLVSSPLVMTFPEIHVRNSRINFKFGDTKSQFYLTETDLDIYPPAGRGADWSVRFSGGPARTDRPSRPFGYLAARGRWKAPAGGRPDRLDLDLQLERSAIGEVITLVRGVDAGIHGTISSRMRLTGPLQSIGIAGRIMVEDVHRWDLLPPHGQGWPLNVRGRLNLIAQTLELESSSPEGEALPLSVRFRVANYLSQPQWGVTATWNRFPVAPLMDLARHMGAQLPPRLVMTGTLDGAAGYDWQRGMEGELAFHDTAVTIPDSPPIRFDEAKLLVDAGGLTLPPALARTFDNDQAEVEATWRWDVPSFDLSISTASMKLASLRAQVALAAVPWLEQVASGAWSGRLRYHYAPSGPETEAAARWSGQVVVKNADFPVAGLAMPVRLEAARAQIQGARIVVDRIQARAGKLTAQGEYRYEPEAVRPHHFRLALGETDAAAVESLLTPTLRRSRAGLIARALGLGRAGVPEWLGARRMEGTVQAEALTLAGTRLERLRAHIVWDGSRVRLDKIGAHVEDGTLTGVLTASLRGPKPVYLLSGRLKNIASRSGKVDAEGVVETRGMGRELLANMRAQGVFGGRGLELGSMPALERVSGAFLLAWAEPEPRLRFWDLQLAAGDEVYTGTGATQEDGRLLIQLTSGAKEMRMRGTLAKLQLDAAAAAPQE